MSKRRKDYAISGKSHARKECSQRRQEAYEDLLAQGIAEREASRQAVQSLGNPREVRRRLAIGILCVLGVGALLRFAEPHEPNGLEAFAPFGAIALFLALACWALCAAFTWWTLGRLIHKVEKYHEQTATPNVQRLRGRIGVQSAASGPG